MRTPFVFLLGTVIGALAIHFLRTRPEPSTPRESGPAITAAAPAQPQPKPSLVEKARTEAREVKDVVAGKLTEWHLTPSDIRDELAKTGEVVRTKAHAAGESISNARIVTVIKARYAVDKELSARSIEVDSDNGNVTLRGTAASHELIARAISIALETEGVTKVKSLITVAASGD